MDYPIRTLRASEFPPLLSEISDPPKQLYVRGTLPDESHTWLCVVGARKNTTYAKEACSTLIAGLAGYPIVVVSGLALGIDGIAHETALTASLPTVAVPGSGLDDRVLYPRSHFSLANRILKSGGALLSEFEPSHTPRPESFPQRNRIMAGLSHAVFVVEAHERSGTLITSRLATEYNRDVLALSHPITNETGAGPHLLLKLGAVPIRTAEDILEALNIEKNSQQTTSMDGLNEREKKIIELLREPMSRDLLQALLGLDVREYNILVSSMEIRGLVKESGGLLYRAS